MPKLNNKVFSEFNLNFTWPSLKIARGKAVGAKIELGFGIVDRNRRRALEWSDSKRWNGPVLDVKLRSELMVFDGADIDG